MCRSEKLEDVGRKVEEEVVRVVSTLLKNEGDGLQAWNRIPSEIHEFGGEEVEVNFDSVDLYPESDERAKNWTQRRVRSVPILQLNSLRIVGCGSKFEGRD